MRTRSEKDHRTPVNFRLPAGLYKWAKKFAKLNNVTVTHLIERGLVMVKDYEYDKKVAAHTTARPRQPKQTGPDPKAPKSYEFKLNKKSSPSGDIEEMPLPHVYGVKDVNKPPKKGKHQGKGARLINAKEVLPDPSAARKKKNATRKAKK